MIQPDLFGIAPKTQRRPRIAYQQTSREAYERIAPVSGALDRLIIEALRTRGPMIDQEIERAIGRSHQSVSGNRRHLVERGIVRDSGEKGKTDAGRSAIKWMVA